MSSKRILIFAISAIVFIFAAVYLFKSNETPEPHIPQNLGEEKGTVTDIDGTTYETVKIGDQWWMAENLKVSRYRNGDSIPHVTDNAEWASLTAGAWSYYEYDSTYHNIYGKLYNWYAAVDPRGLCPEGWHVPTEDEWRILETFLGGRRTSQGLMKSTRTDPDPHPRWDKPNEGATNESGFSGLPGGYRRADGNFRQPWNDRVTTGFVGSWWSSTEYNNKFAYFRDLGWVITEPDRDFHSEKRGGKSIRCIKY